MNRFVIVVDDDVDPMNLEEVMWAVSTRCEPAEDIEIMRKSWGSKVDPMLADPAVPYNTPSSTRAAHSKSSTPFRASRSRRPPGPRDSHEMEGAIRRSAFPPS